MKGGLVMHLKKERGLLNLMREGMNLFRENGFEKTTSRMIAQTAGISQGLMNHYFVSKDNLGTQVLGMLYEYVNQFVNDTIEMKDDPVMYYLVDTLSFNEFLRTKGYYDFYIDSLRHDLFFPYLWNKPLSLIDELKPANINPDLNLIYTRYLPYMMEKTLVLKKLEEDSFGNISDEEIPFLPCQEALEHLVPRKFIEEFKEQSIKSAKSIVKKIPEIPDEDFILKFIRDHESDFKENTKETAKQAMDLAIGS